jgi:hypothetical protein
MRTFAGPAALILSILLSLALAVLGGIEGFYASAVPEITHKNSMPYAAALVELGKLDLAGVQHGSEGYGLPALSYDPNAPNSGLAIWLATAHRSRHPSAALSVACFAAAATSMLIAILIWLQRPRTTISAP